MSENVIEVRGLTRQFGRKTALNDIALSIPRGEVFGLVGENGAGKTTLLKHLLGLFNAQSGSVTVFGLDPVANPEEVLGRIGYLSEDRDLPDWMNVQDLIKFTAAFYSNWDSAYAEDLRQTFDLQPKQKVKSLSRGQRARIGLLLALAHRPELLILDEPSSGLDPVVRRDILGAIIRTVADEGRTVLFSSHLLDEVQRVADRVALIHHGEVVLSESLDDVLNSHCWLIARFPESLNEPPLIEGVLRGEGEGREWTILCNGKRQKVEQQLHALRAEIVEQRTPSLEEIFIARAGSIPAKQHSS
jgi:ABC-2 type transport system ATP-binding protein